MQVAAKRGGVAQGPAAHPAGRGPKRRQVVERREGSERTHRADRDGTVPPHVVEAGSAEADDALGAKRAGGGLRHQERAAAHQGRAGLADQTRGPLGGGREHVLADSHSHLSSWMKRSGHRPAAMLPTDELSVIEPQTRRRGGSDAVGVF